VPTPPDLTHADTLVRHLTSADRLVQRAGQRPCRTDATTNVRRLAVFTVGPRRGVDQNGKSSSQYFERAF
jgi:hypothetical protein